ESNSFVSETVQRSDCPLTRPNYAPIYDSHSAFYSSVLRKYSRLTPDAEAKDCADFLGLTKYCADRDAYVAIAPMLGPGVEAAACSSGVIFACATLAID